MPSADPPLGALFARFLRFGCMAWGGPVAQIGMIKRELVDEERWIDPARFNRLLAVYQVLPGPEAHELCVHLGMVKRGRLGGFLAGLGFMLPGLLLILALAWIYRKLDLHQPAIAAAFLGVQIGVVALIARAVHRITEHALGNVWLWAIALGSAAASALGVSFWVVLPAAGLCYAALAGRRFALAAAGLLVAVVLSFAAALVGPHVAPATARTVEAGSVGAAMLFLSGLKAGLLTFGGAYTAIPFVRGDAVGRGWVSDAQFLDSLALSGIIPAPLIIFATIVGYLAGGMAGALAITVGIFLPAFSFGLLFYERLERVIANSRLHHFLEGVAAGVVGLIAVTTTQLGYHVAVSVPSAIVAAAAFAGSLALLYWWKSKLNVPAVILGSAVLGLVFLGPAR